MNLKDKNQDLNPSSSPLPPSDNSHFANQTNNWPDSQSSSADYSSQPSPHLNNHLQINNYNQYNHQTQKQGNGLAVGGFVVALVSIFTIFLPILNLILSVIGLILSSTGIKKAKKINDNGKGLAIAGMIISILTTTFSLIYSAILLLTLIGIIDGINEINNGN